MGKIGKNWNGMDRFGNVARADDAGRISKGGLWVRGISLAEAEIDGGWEPSGRWRRFGDGDGERTAAVAAGALVDASSGVAVPAVAEEAGFASMAA